MNTKQNNELMPITKVDIEALTSALIDKKDITEGSRKDFKIRIPLFLEFLENHPLNRDTYIEYKQYLTSRNDYAVSTKAKYLHVARLALQELHRQNFLPVDITVGIRGYRLGHKHRKEGITDDEMKLIMKKVNSLPESKEKTRIRAILSLLALQGLRQIEIVRLNVEDLDLMAKTAMVLGKGRDERELIYLHPETVKCISDYLSENKVKSGPLFVSQSNNSLNQRLTTRSIRAIIDKLLTTLGIPKTVHGFRHYFTTTLIRIYKGDLTEVAGYTRHESLEMLRVYNDNVKKQSDLPRYYKAFENLKF